MAKESPEQRITRLKLPLTPSSEVTRVSGNRCRKLAPNSITTKLVGQKAFGLASIPSIWTKPFFVIAGCSRPTRNAIRRALEQFDLHLTDHVLIRSSGTNESINARGTYDSVPCAPDDIVETIHELESKAPAEGNPAETIHWIVQEYIHSAAKGHLSNERRLFKDDRDWLAEIESTQGQGHESHVIAIRPWRDARNPEPTHLSCPYKANYVGCLKTVARWAFFRTLRAHLEWVWDGNSVFIVQADNSSESDRGADPETVGSTRAQFDTPASLSLFRKASDSDFEHFRKLENTRIYQTIGYQVVDFFLMANSAELKRIIDKGTVSAALKKDLAELTKSPLIIRTDGSSLPADKRTMLPRSDELRCTNDAVEWLTGKFRMRIRESGLQNGELCLIAHNFVPSVSSAWCQAHPDSRRVRIESLWGIPEGLYWYNHDVFDVDTLINDASHEKPQRPFHIGKRIRFKPRFIAPDASGKWVMYETMEGPDWSSSIKHTRWIEEIAWASRKIANEVGHSVVVMWLIDIPKARSTHNVMPWYHERWEPATLSLQAAPRHRAPQNTEFTISKRKDWDDLKSRCARGERVSRVFITPHDPDLVRDPNFAKEVGRTASEKGFVVELSGGILSHAYYLLKSAGCVVECSDLYATTDEQLEFNKLVRDEIPSLITSQGERVEVVHLAGEALIECLKRKVVEESFEVLDAKNTDELADELADLLEVVEQLRDELNISEDDIAYRKEEKRRRRGGFEKGLMLQSTTLASSLSSGSPELTLNLELPADEDPRTISLIEKLPPPYEDINKDVRHDGTGLSQRQLTITLPVYTPESMTQKFSLHVDTLSAENRHALLEATLERSGANAKIKIKILPIPTQEELDFDSESSKK